MNYDQELELLSLEAGSLAEEYEKALAEFNGRQSNLSVEQSFLPNVHTALNLSRESYLKHIFNAAEKLLEVSYRAFDNAIKRMSLTRQQAESKLFRLNQLKARVEKGSSYDHREVLEFTMGKFLVVDSQTITPGEIVKGLDNLKKVLFKETIDNTDINLKVLDKIYPRMRTLINEMRKETKNKDTILRVVQLVSDDALQIRRKDLSSSYLKKEYYNDKIVHTTDLLMGKAKLQYITEPVDESEFRGTNMQLVSAIERLTSTTSRVEIESDKLKDHYEMNTATTREILNIAEHLIPVYETFIAYHIRYHRTILSSRDKLKAFRNDLNTLSKAGDNDENNIYVRKLSALLHSINRWLYSPTVPFIGHAIKVCNSTLTYIEKSEMAIRKSNNKIT